MPSLEQLETGKPEIAELPFGEIVWLHRWAASTVTEQALDQGHPGHSGSPVELSESYRSLPLLD